MSYRAIRGFNYRGQRFEAGDVVSGLPIKETRQLIKDQTVEDVSGVPIVEKTKEIVKDAIEEGGENIDG